MGETHARVSEALHEKMKSISKQKGTKIKEEYDAALQEYIQRFEEKKVLQDSELEKMLDEKLAKVDSHLSSMLGRTGLDASMILVGLAYFLEDYYEKDIADIFNRLRTDGVDYFTNKSKTLKRDDRFSTSKSDF
ncbi:hypothetical protein [Clostridium sp.]|uniref:hypothetical protein n=1 Tax=Clostridium sp. TaxID=1506 RepID=UPI003F37B77F